MNGTGTQVVGESRDPRTGAVSVRTQVREAVELFAFTAAACGACALLFQAALTWGN